MIELNCTYEESKKILELGYDFSKVCWKTGYYWDKAYLEHTHGTGLLIETQAYRISYLNDHKGNTRDHTPIIPKAALQATLPDWVEVRLTNGLRVECGFTTHPVSNTVEVYRLDNCQIVIYFNTNLEAFMWCHENYPEELKKKFDEVMA